jgi:hypothetical protein
MRKAYETMIDQAERIADEDERRMFLEKVKVNQEINASIQELKASEPSA